MKNVKTTYGDFHESRNPTHVYPTEWVVRTLLGNYPQLYIDTRRSPLSMSSLIIFSHVIPAITWTPALASRIAQRIQPYSEARRYARRFIAGS